MPALTPVRGRMQPVYGHPAGARIIIDFAHTPDALEVALDALRAQTPDKLKVVFVAAVTAINQAPKNGCYRSQTSR